MKDWAVRHRLGVAIVACICFASIGFFSFWGYGFRFGWHPATWRVEGARRTLLLSIQACFTGNDYERTKFMVCAQKKIARDMHWWGTHALMQALEARLGSEKNDRNITQCHDLAHAIGWAGTVVTQNLQTVLPACTNTCVYGCQHGAVSAWYGMGKNILDALPTLCTQGMDWSKNPQGQGGCFHELGHAIANAAAYDMKTSLTYCDKVSATGRVDCAAGVFMEMFEAATFAPAPLPLPADHPAWCATLWSPYKEYCFDQAGVNDYGSFQNDERAFGVCRRVPTENQQGCFQNLGQNIFYVYQHQKNHLQAVESFCRRAPDPWFFPCITGVLMSSASVEPGATSGIALCRQLPAGQQSECFRLFGSVLDRKRTPQEKTVLCNGLRDTEIQSCLSSKNN